MSEFECALTGKVVETDGEESFPTGWTRVTITRRQMNPKWAMLMQVQNALIEGALSQVPAEMQDIQRFVITAQVEAQFYSLMKDTPTYVVDVEDEVFICDSGEITETLNEVREMLGLKAMPAVEAEEEEASTAIEKAEE